jgi:hypothetical protein
VLLPAAPPPDTTLTEALARRPVPGRPAGPLTSAELATLLWYAHATIRAGTDLLADGTPHDDTYRPHPGEARLRLLAYDVEGLASGRYQVDGVARSLWYLGRPAGRDRVAAALGGGAGPSALLGLYTAAGARRCALVEAGHLAQNLALVAAAAGLDLATVCRFPARTGRILFGLVPSRQLVYLLPLGRVRGRSAPPS